MGSANSYPAIICMTLDSPTPTRYKVTLGMYLHVSHCPFLLIPPQTPQTCIRKSSFSFTDAHIIIFTMCYFMTAILFLMLISFIIEIYLPIRFILKKNDNSFLFHFYSLSFSTPSILIPLIPPGLWVLNFLVCKITLVVSAILICSFQLSYCKLYHHK